MHTRLNLSILTVVGLMLVAGCESVNSSGIGKSVLDALGQGRDGELTLGVVIDGLKEALRVGTENTVKSTSARGGYLSNPLIRIPMPEKLQSMASALQKIGLGAQVDSFEQKMNEAAELAAREATPVFLDAIRQMTFEDANNILRGHDTAATDYFREKTAAALKQRYLPIVSGQMQQLGAVKVYKDMETKYNQLPFVPKTTVSVEDYVTDKALAGLFTVLAAEEQKIRQDPAARTTALLRQVFGQSQ